MIIWINGPFGVGKSTTAAEVVRQLPGALIFDPERYGWVLQRTVGLVKRGDYQDLAAWRRGTIRGAVRRSQGGAVVIVPMSLLEPAHLDEIMQGLQRRGRTTLHVTLHASLPVLMQRIAADTADTGAHDWRVSQAIRYQGVRDRLALEGPVIDTDALEAGKVAESILTLIAGHHSP